MTPFLKDRSHDLAQLSQLSQCILRWYISQEAFISHSQYRSYISDWRPGRTALRDENENQSQFSLPLLSWVHKLYLRSQQLEEILNSLLSFCAFHTLSKSTDRISISDGPWAHAVWEMSQRTLSCPSSPGTWDTLTLTYSRESCSSILKQSSGLNCVLGLAMLLVRVGRRLFLKFLVPSIEEIIDII